MFFVYSWKRLDFKESIGKTLVVCCKYYYCKLFIIGCYLDFSIEILTSVQELGN